MPGSFRFGDGIFPLLSPGISRPRTNCRNRYLPRPRTLPKSARAAKRFGVKSPIFQQCHPPSVATEMCRTVEQAGSNASVRDGVVDSAADDCACRRPRARVSTMRRLQGHNQRRQSRGRHQAARGGLHRKYRLGHVHQRHLPYPWPIRLSDQDRRQDLGGGSTSLPTSSASTNEVFASLLLATAAVSADPAAATSDVTVLLLDSELHRCLYSPPLGPLRTRLSHGRPETEASTTAVDPPACADPQEQRDLCYVLGYRRGRAESVEQFDSILWDSTGEIESADSP